MSPRAVVDVHEIERTIRRLGLADRPIELHVSVRSFGSLAGGPATIVDGALGAGSTVLAATMAPDLFGIPAPPHDRPRRNGIGDVAATTTAGATSEPALGRVYDPTSIEVSAWLGAFSQHVAARPDRVRCRHPCGEFAAVGPLAARLIEAETDADVYGPLRALLDADGAVILMGVGLTRMTLLHLAEIAAGRRAFIRWARGADGRPVRVRAGECSEGFERLASALAPIEQQVVVGHSRWRVFPAAGVVALAARAIRANPSLTHCPNPDCIECADAIAGGPLD